jgi:hypothetical protein
MRRFVALAGLALALVCALAPEPAAAEDADVRYIVTNGGVDVEGKGEVHYSPAGRHDQSVDWARSGDLR